MGVSHSGVPLGTGWDISVLSKQKTLHMHRSTKLSLALTTTLLLCTAPLFGATVRDFADDHVLAGARTTSTQDRDAQNIGIALINNLDQPEALASFGNPSATTIHRKPGTPGTSDLGNNDGSSVDVKSTVVVPLPTPAGLAIAGLVFLGLIRRR